MELRVTNIAGATRGCRRAVRLWYAVPAREISYNQASFVQATHVAVVLIDATGKVVDTSMSVSDASRESPRRLGPEESGRSETAPSRAARGNHLNSCPLGSEFFREGRHGQRAEERGEVEHGSTRTTLRGRAGPAPVRARDPTDLFDADPPTFPDRGREAVRLEALNAGSTCARAGAVVGRVAPVDSGFRRARSRSGREACHEPRARPMTDMDLSRVRVDGLSLGLGLVIVIVALASGCAAVGHDRATQRGVDGGVPAVSQHPTNDVDDSRRTAPAVALEALAPPVPHPPLAEAACRRLLSQRRALIAKGTTRCTEDSDCGTYGDARHPCGEGAIDQHTASEVERIDESLLGDECYLRRTGTCHVTPYGYRAICARSGRCAVK